MPFKFKAIKVSELKSLSEKGWDILIKDIEGFNWDADFEKEMEDERIRFACPAHEAFRARFRISRAT